jgi:hypothetical protein
MWRSQGSAAVVESLLTVRWDSRWEDGPGDPSNWTDCRRYQTGLYGDPSDQEGYWLFACQKPLMGGTWKTSYYLLGNGEALTLERTYWRLDFDEQLPESASSSAYKYLVAAFARRLGAPPVLPGKTRVDLDDFRSAVWKTGRRFDTKQGPFWVYLERDADPEHDVLVVDRESAGLWREERDPGLIDGSSRAGSEVGRPELTRKDLARGLDTVDPNAARALRRSKAVWSDLLVFTRALERVRTSRTTGEAADLVRLAGHAWLGMVQDSLVDNAKEWERIVRALAPVGVRFMRDKDMDWMYCGSLLSELIGRAGTNRWTDEAFAEWVEGGALDSCECEEQAPDRVIAQGESFLRDHPSSPACIAVERAVAEGHETLWSLSQVTSVDGDYTSYPSWLALTGAGHRDQALALYRDVLRRAPAGWKLERLRRRVRRIEIGVDTGQRAFFCPGDD